MAEETTSRAAVSKRSAWDFTLMMLTVAMLGGLGVQSFVGTLYAWYMGRAVQGWDQSAAYGGYIDVMNAIAAPQLIALVVVMGLCVPKRLFSKRALVVASTMMLAVGLVVWGVTGNPVTGLAAYLALSGLIQVAVVGLTLGGARGLTFLSTAQTAKVGSGLLHLGFIITALVVAMQGSRYMLPGFWVATALTTVGTGMTFYASRQRGRTASPE